MRSKVVCLSVLLLLAFGRAKNLVTEATHPVGVLSFANLSCSNFPGHGSRDFNIWLPTYGRDRKAVESQIERFLKARAA